MKTMRLTMLSLLVAAAAFAADEVKTIQATGEAAIFNDNHPDPKGRAKDEAKKAAFRSAVENVAGTLVNAYSLSRDSTLVSDRIYTNAQGYVKNVRDEKYSEKDGVISYSATVDVVTSAIDKDLQAVKQLVHALEGKKLVLLLQEQAIDPKGVVTSSGAMTQALTTAFRDDGWTIVDPSFAAGKVRVASGVGLGATEAKEIGNLTKADYILYGRVNFRYQDTSDLIQFKNTPMFPVTGEWDLALFATDSGSQVTTVAGALKSDLKTFHENKGSLVVSYERTAFDLARMKGNSIVSEVRKAAYAYLADARQNGNRVVVEVMGLEDYGTAEEFKAVLGARKGMNSVGDCQLTDGKATYEVSFLGTTSELATQFTKTTFQKKKVKVTGKTANKVVLTVGK